MQLHTLENINSEIKWHQLRQNSGKKPTEKHIYSLSRLVSMTCLFYAVSTHS
jgi:hypothetical protein